jgi:hypothetical protein
VPSSDGLDLWAAMVAARAAADVDPVPPAGSRGDKDTDADSGTQSAAPVAVRTEVVLSPWAIISMDSSGSMWKMILSDHDWHWGFRQQAR